MLVVAAVMVGTEAGPEVEEEPQPEALVVAVGAMIVVMGRTEFQKAAKKKFQVAVARGRQCTASKERRAPIAPAG